MSRLDILAAGYSAILGVEVVTPEKAASLGLQLPLLHANSVFEHTHLQMANITKAMMVDHTSIDSIYSIDPFNVSMIAKFKINIKTIQGWIFEIPVKSTHSIAEVKSLIEMLHPLLPARKQKLTFLGTHLDDYETIESIGISPNDTMCISLNLRGGSGPACVLDVNTLAPSFDYDFTNLQDDGTNFQRGGFEYHRPYGWYRYALKVLDISKYKSNTWLGEPGLRTATSDGEWPVAYHGTNMMENVKGIVKEGYDPKRSITQKFGEGIYSTPFVMTAKAYAEKFEHGGRMYKVILQNRINPHPNHLKIIPVADTLYYLSTKHDPKKGVYDVRPYGVLIKEL